VSDEIDQDGPRDGEILPPSEVQGEQDSALSQTLIALVSSYTDRPDLLVAEIEKHDPGFVKRMNAASEAHAEEGRRERFKFGKVQAYTALCVSVVAAAALLGALYFAIHKDAGFGVYVGLFLFYAVTQGGPGGFARIIDSLRHVVPSSRPEDKKTD